MSPDYEVTIDGVPFAGADMSWERNIDALKGDLQRFSSAFTEVSASFSVSLEGAETLAVALNGFLEALRAPGASDRTLVRRVKYGGRKGRSALRRLLRRAPPLEMSTADGHRFRGKAVFFNEREAVFKAQRSAP